jgi:AcrR family transcriptional regulator
VKSNRSKKSRMADTPHPTATQLIEGTVELLDSMPIESVGLVMVLEHTGISHGSLYHHFEDFSDLVEQAVVHRYTRRLKDSLSAVRTLLECTTADEFRSRQEEIFTLSIEPERKANRMERIEVLGALRNHPRLAAKIARAQQDITDEQAELIKEFQQRGWLRADLDPTALSAYIQALIVGRIVDDVSERPIDRDTWETFALRSLRAVIDAS